LTVENYRDYLISGERLATLAHHHSEDIYYTFDNGRIYFSKLRDAKNSIDMIYECAMQGRYPEYFDHNGIGIKAGDVIVYCNTAPTVSVDEVLKVRPDMTAYNSRVSVELDDYYGRYSIIRNDIEFDGSKMLLSQYPESEQNKYYKQIKNKPSIIKGNDHGKADTIRS